MVITKQPQIGGEGIALVIVGFLIDRAYVATYSSRAQRLVSVQYAQPWSLLSISFIAVLSWCAALPSDAAAQLNLPCESIRPRPVRWASG